MSEENGQGAACTTAEKSPSAAAEQKPCLACSGPTEQQEQAARRKALATSTSSTPAQGKTPFAYMHSGCPVNRRELGRASWAFLHTMAAYYPEKPSRQEQDRMRDFMHLYVQLYPCGYCGDTTWQEMMRNPPRLATRKDFSLWMCEMHNEVNDRLGKPQFDCSKVDERWRTGPADGSCN
ncbi:hypothetical protein PTSG_09636 [Salpingoeca rosetta]|uniref:Sulfhydryl oxidase n=1 Tax=Salpingoeca rosetta (strain ATCC 50818 / BSB-021) TaxID=946362 RepID=F2ULJ9_SALR5|nr:uncharacterized protein PTSG_09636 [Salpingoeca rosetta]EGD77998.1 hypothetical protein PTSG_09636 [Salpingoeca rosetta]|eukprot:XP_004990060.1 hypothetical protein PTSG_09636 [Salpingoeca rosetta]